MLHSVCDAGLCDFIKGNAVLQSGIEIQNIGKVPGDCLSLTIRVGCEQYGFTFFRRALQLLNQLFLSFDNLILGFKVVLYIHAQTVLLQVANMSHRCDDFVTGA